MAQASELAAVKLYMRVEEDGDDAIIAALYDAAVIYLENAGIQRPQEKPELYNLAVWGLTLHYYDHRDETGNETALPAGLRPILNQLKLLGQAGAEGEEGADAGLHS